MAKWDDPMKEYEAIQERRLNYCRFSMKVMLIIGIILMVISMLSCASSRLPATTSTGYVISVDGDQVLVTFEVVNESRGSQASNWFYIPKHSYRKGDLYPDCRKDPMIICSTKEE